MSPTARRLAAALGTLGAVAVVACSSFGDAETSDGTDDAGAGLADALAADGASSDGAAGGDGGAASDAAVASCPAGRGAPMVRVGGFCIDARETTFGDYRQFMLAGASTAASTVPPECGFKTSFAPSFWPRPASDDPLPAHDIDWCDAWAYCAWAGKRLCGGPNGAKLVFATPIDPTDEWYRACTNELTTQFTYGASFDVSRCNVSGHLDSGLAPGPPGSFPSCRGTSPPLDGVTDLVGNIGEWQHSCDEVAGVDAGMHACRVRGGNWYDNDEQGCTDTDVLARNTRQSKAGVRCCADPR